MRKRLRQSLLSVAVIGLLLGSAAAVAPVSQAQVAPCVATVTPPPIYETTTVHISVTGLSPNEPYTGSATYNGVSSPISATASATGTITIALTYKTGTWVWAWHGTTSGATCSVSYTVLASPTTTTSSTTTTAAPATTAPPAAAAQAVTSSPSLTG